ncbi:hypothetical protein CVD28_00125 [Bacillus sp. M6-12]|uniref:hypothetical protein n=1 Tax=Bacillus sp. M6-12 TaxID=2054166 RepID=UPI000C78AE00|nr:hypothetical protein [Bacillus sp. M6-12]PLS18843.1 hypothetical protein CVD28_00125 [Bacillus sp. M6-12]
MKKEIQNLKSSFTLFFLASGLFFMSWVLSGFEGMMWVFLAFINACNGFIFMNLYRKKLKEEGVKKNE